MRECDSRLILTNQNVNKLQIGLTDSQPLQVYEFVRKKSCSEYFNVLVHF